MKMGKALSKIASVGLLNSLVAFVAIQSVGKACMWFFHQPKVPDCMDEYRVK